MKLILRADVEAVGRLGQIVTVKPGYGCKYLVPQGLAMPATESNLKQFELERMKLQAKADTLRTSAADVAERMNGVALTIAVRVGENDKLYGSVTWVNIADVLAAEKGIEIDRRKIVLPEAIRALGEYEVEVRLHPDVHAAIKLSVVREGHVAEEPEQSAPETTDEQQAEGNDQQA
jgi:ribosomal protein L9